VIRFELDRLDRCILCADARELLEAERRKRPRKKFVTMKEVNERIQQQPDRKTRQWWLAWMIYITLMKFREQVARHPREFKKWCKDVEGWYVEQYLQARRVTLQYCLDEIRGEYEQSSR